MSMPEIYQKHAKRLCEILIDLASELEPNEFKSVFFASILGVASALPDEYWEEMIAKSASDKMGKAMQEAADEFTEAINKCRITQKTRLNKLN